MGSSGGIAGCMVLGSRLHFEDRARLRRYRFRLHAAVIFSAFALQGAKILNYFGWLRAIAEMVLYWSTIVPFLYLSLDFWEGAPKIWSLRMSAVE